MNHTTPAQIERACTELTTDGETVTFTAVARRTHLARTTLYRNPTLRAIIDEHRRTSGTTLTGLAHDITTIQIALESLAIRVRHHEEQLRRLQRTDTNRATR